MLHSGQLWNFHQPADGVFFENLSIWGEHRAQFKRQDARKSAATFAVGGGDFFCRFSVQAGGLKQNGNAPERDDVLHFLAVQRYHVAGLALDVRAGYEWQAVSE